MNTRDEFRNVTVTGDGSRRCPQQGYICHESLGRHTSWLGVVGIRYAVSQSVASCRLNAGWLSCCYSRWATRQ